MNHEEQRTYLQRKLKIAGEEEESADWALRRAVDAFRMSPSLETEGAVMRAMSMLASKRDLRRLWQESVKELESEEV